MIRKNNLVNRILLAALLVFSGTGQTFAQHMRQQPNTYTDGRDQSGTGTGFSKESLFIGGGLSLGVGSYNFNIGATPEIGYSLNKWLDAGIALNLNYYSIRADPYYNGNVRTRSFNYGGGVFARAWPVSFLFFQLQPEFNFIDYHERQMDNGATYNTSTNAPSLLAGIGYGQRFVGQSNFFLSISIDLLNSAYSPYRDYNGTVLPVIRGGFDIYLHKRRG